MNKQKWANPDIPYEVLALKLAEEAAEVGGEITDAAMAEESINLRKLVTECDHAIFIAQRIRNRALDALDEV